MGMEGGMKLKFFVLFGIDKRGSTREKAFLAIIDAFKTNLQHQFVEKK